MVRIVDVNEQNIDEQVLFCKKTKQKQPGYQNKVKWMKERFKEGLKYKMLYVKEGSKETSRGMIEYMHQATGDTQGAGHHDAQQHVATLTNTVPRQQHACIGLCQCNEGRHNNRNRRDPGP